MEVIELSDSGDDVEEVMPTKHRAGGSTHGAGGSSSRGGRSYMWTYSKFGAEAQDKATQQAIEAAMASSATA